MLHSESRGNLYGHRQQDKEEQSCTEEQEKGSDLGGVQRAHSGSAVEGHTHPLNFDLAALHPTHLDCIGLQGLQALEG